MIPVELDILCHVAYALILTGTYMVAQKKTRGWLLEIIGESILIGAGIIYGMSSLIVWGFIFALVNIYGYRTWKRNENKQRQS